MSDKTKFQMALTGWTALMLFIGVAVGTEESNRSLQTEITKLSIELTTLNIKKLKGECNES